MVTPPCPIACASAAAPIRLPRSSRCFCMASHFRRSVSTTASLCKFSPLMCLSYHNAEIVCACYFRERHNFTLTVFLVAQGTFLIQLTFDFANGLLTLLLKCLRFFTDFGAPFGLIPRLFEGLSSFFYFFSSYSDNRRFFFIKNLIYKDVMYGKNLRKKIL
jgi:hypothetical protein